MVTDLALLISIAWKLSAVELSSVTVLFSTLSTKISTEDFLVLKARKLYACREYFALFRHKLA